MPWTPPARTTPRSNLFWTSRSWSWKRDILLDITTWVETEPICDRRYIFLSSP